MLEPREFRGFWWVPEEQDKKVAGTLTFAQGRVRLELLGVLGAWADDFQMPGPLPRILGLSSDGKELTLERCRPAGHRVSTTGLTTSAFRPNLILVGAWYEQDEEVRFDELRLRYSDLDVWATTSGFTVSLASGDDIVSGIDIAYRAPPPIVIPIKGGTLEVVFSWNLSDLAPVTTDVRVAQTAAFVVRADEPIDLARSLDFVYQLRNFLGLAVGRPVAVEAVTGAHLPPADAKVDPLTRLGPRKMNVEVLYRLARLPEAGRNLHPQEMLFTLADAGSRIETVFQRWFARQEILRPVFDLYFGAVYNRDAYVEHTFLSLVQALETYHRRTSTRTDLPPDEHEKRVKAIIAATSGEHRKWLEGKLRYRNELILRDRLEDVLARCPELSAKVTRGKSSFVPKVVTARNYQTHYDLSLEKQAVTGSALGPLNVQLQALVEMCLLLELGFECSEIDAIFDRVRRFERIEVAFGP
jgi:hypothetical protein